MAIVLGILGMHVLDLHSPTSPAPVSGAFDTSGHLEHPAGDLVPGPTVGAPHHPGHDMGDMGDMVMLCAAMLVAAGLTLLASWLLRRVPTSSWTVSRSRLATVLRRRAHVREDTGPPPVWAFSVIRC